MRSSASTTGGVAAAPSVTPSPPPTIPTTTASSSIAPPTCPRAAPERAQDTELPRPLERAQEHPVENPEPGEPGHQDEEQVEDEEVPADVREGVVPDVDATTEFDGLRVGVEVHERGPQDPHVTLLVHGAGPEANADLGDHVARLAEVLLHPSIGHDAVDPLVGTRPVPVGIAHRGDLEGHGAAARRPHLHLVPHLVAEILREAARDDHHALGLEAREQRGVVCEGSVGAHAFAGGADDEERHDYAPPPSRPR